MTTRRAADHPLSDRDFQALAAFRTALRRFVRFSEEAARHAGLTPQQHQILVAIRGHAGPEAPTVGDLAQALQIKHHSAVGLVDRVVQRGWALRVPSKIDNRRVHVLITSSGETVLRSLTAAHREEHRLLEEVLRHLTEEMEES